MASKDDGFQAKDDGIMPAIKILSIGKNKERWLEEALLEYQKRLRNSVSVDFQWFRTDDQLINVANKSAGVIGLDPSGKQMTSEDFSLWLYNQWETHGAHLTMVIGGHQGLPLTLKEKVPLISLSKLTFTHQITRLILLEQIYRAIEISKNSPYHK